MHTPNSPLRCVCVFCKTGKKSLSFCDVCIVKLICFQKDIQLLKTLSAEFLSTTNLLTDKNTTTISDIEQEISILVQHCQISVNTFDDTFQTGKTPVDHTAQQPGDLHPTFQTNFPNSSTLTAITKSQQSSSISSTESTPPTEAQSRMKLIENQECSAAMDRAKTKLAESLRNHQGFADKLSQLEKLLKRHLEAHLDAPRWKEEHSYVGGFKVCLAQVYSLKLAVDLVHSQNTSDLVTKIVSSRTNETVQEGCNWMDSYGEQLSKDTKTAEAEMREGLSLHKNMKKAYLNLKDALWSYRAWGLRPYQSVGEMITEYLAGNISKLELVRILPGQERDEDWAGGLLNALSSFGEEIQSAPDAQRSNTYNFMLSEGLQTALWNTTTLPKLEIFRFLSSNYDTETRHLSSAKQMLKELHKTTESPRDKLRSTVFLIHKIGNIATEQFEASYYGPKFLKESTATLQKNLDSYSKSLEMNQEFYL